ncbi:hypothetical protein EJ08DRAFT_683291 [Tothia fuscella]|uniref:Uncharacterized protein n=1 Tax=Tothia fuscella TaxID=1048955 RepID=A0A9P4NGA0_9PEZI|nr:hypothetical protein EJ08DRAFT_683291 [Tothia fuscella]
MVSFSTICNIGMWVLPVLIPRGLAFYRSIRSASQGPNTQVRPPPLAVRRCLNILFAVVIFSLLFSLPYFAPANIFAETGSRLLLKTNLLEARLSALRQGNLTAVDQRILHRLEKEPDTVRFMYAAYGPDVVANCIFCKATDPSSYLYYALPAVITPHLIHIAFLGLITSSFVSGVEGSRWRTHATIAGVVLAAAELYWTWTYNWEANRTVRMVKDVDFFYWNMRTYRHLAFALVDALLGWALWLTSTKRWMVVPASITQQIAATTEQVGILYSKTHASGHIRNTIVRDRELRNVYTAYWEREQAVMHEIDQEREVVDARNIALSRMDYDKVQQRAGNYVDQIFSQFEAVRPQQGAASSAQDNTTDHLHEE